MFRRSQKQFFSLGRVVRRVRERDDEGYLRDTLNYSPSEMDSHLLVEHEPPEVADRVDGSLHRALKSTDSLPDKTLLASSGYETVTRNCNTEKALNLRSYDRPLQILVLDPVCVHVLSL